jgi:hypothetical protein
MERRQEMLPEIGGIAAGVLRAQADELVQIEEARGVEGKRARLVALNQAAIVAARRPSRGLRHRDLGPRGEACYHQCRGAPCQAGLGIVPL